MNLRKTLPVVLAVAAIGLIADSAMGERVPIKGHGTKDVKASCDGAYFPPNKLGVYGCMNQDGSGIVCGGTGKDAKTCDTFRKAPPCLPTRADIRKVEKAEQTQGSEKK
jgi:hypothetical protein